MNRRGRVFFLLILVAAAVYQTYRNPAFFQSAWYTDSPVTSFFRPVGRFFAATSERIGLSWDSLFSKRSAEKIAELSATVVKLEAENRRLDERLDACLSGFCEGANALPEIADSVVPARILLFDFFPTSKTALIDKGVSDGLHSDDVVVTAGGLVGRVLQVHADTSKILLVVDSGFSVDAVSRETGVRVLVSGVDSGSLKGERLPFLTQIEYLDKARELDQGDVLVTSGLGGVFPRGLVIGSIDKVIYSDKSLFDSAWVLPAVDFAKLTRVFVIKRERPKEGKTVE